MVSSMAPPMATYPLRQSPWIQRHPPSVKSQPPHHPATSPMTFGALNLDVDLPPLHGYLVETPERTFPIFDLTAWWHAFFPENEPKTLFPNTISSYRENLRRDRLRKHALSRLFTMRKNKVESITDNPTAAEIVYNLYEYLFNRKSFQRIVPHAANVLNQYPTETNAVFALGRSPLLLCEIAHYLSGESWSYTPILGSNTRDILKLPNLDDPRIQVYKHYLNALGLSPQVIMKRANEGQKTVLADFAKTGDSMRGILRVLEEWAQEEGYHPQDLKKALVLHFFALSKETYQYQTVFQREGYQVNTQPNTPSEFEDMTWQDLKRISSRLDSFDVGKEWPFEQWDAQHLKALQDHPNDETVQCVKFLIIDHMARLGLLPRVRRPLQLTA